MTVLRVDTIAGIGQTFGPLLDGDLEFNSQNYIVLPKGSSNQQGVLRTTEDVIGVGGTHYDNLVLAMPFNEATGLRDVSSRNRNPGAYGNVAISTAQSKYYGSSVGFSSATNDHLVFGESDDWTFGSVGDFSIELWVYPNSNLGTHSCLVTNIKDWGTDYENAFGLGISGTTLNWYSSNGNANMNCSISANTWSHVSVIRSGSTITLYLNGVSQATTTNNQNFTSKNPLYLGVFLPVQNVRRFDGYLQDLRVYKGIVKYTANFTPPERIAEIGVGFKTGALRYNTDSNKPELYDGNQWTELQISNVGLGTAGDTGPGARGLLQGGMITPVNTDTIDYINISSTGNSLDFGNLSQSRNTAGACASSTRGICAGGIIDTPAPAYVDTIDYVTISSTGNSTDFGNLAVNRRILSGCSSSTRGLFGGGYHGPGTTYNNIDYITISSEGVNAQDFGDLTVARYGLSSFSSPIRGIWAGGYGAPSYRNTIDFVTIATLGSAQDFGDTITSSYYLAGCSNSTRGIFAEGSGPSSPSSTNTIAYVTIATTGNAMNFGDLTVVRRETSSCSSPTRGVFSGGYVSPSPTPNYNIIDYIEILTQGNAVDFGDLVTGTRRSAAGCSNAHGGL